MDILIAVRGAGKRIVLNSKGECIVLDRLFESVDGVIEYLEDTGLAEIFRERKIKDLVDYVFGIETGLDSNARKNRSGDVMENVVGKILSDNDIPIVRKFILLNGLTCKLYLVMIRNVLTLLLKRRKRTIS